MKTTVKIPGSFLLAFVLLSLVFASCVEAQKPVSLSSDEVVRERLVQLKGEAFKKGNVCIERVPELGEVIAVGVFRYDYGCHLTGVFVNNVYYEADKDLSKKVLTALGWKKWNPQQREKMALAWSEKVLLSFYTVLSVKDKDLKSNDFQPPRAQTNEQGATVVTLWIAVPPRMRRGKEFKRIEYKFAADGSLPAGFRPQTFA